MIRLKGNWETKQVWLNGEHLNPVPSQKVWNYSPDGFNWGYGGSRPAQLALAILLKFYPKEEAVLLHQTFKGDHIAKLPKANFDVEINLESWREKYPPLKDGQLDQEFFKHNKMEPGIRL
jgi:hypothetical protein